MTTGEGDLSGNTNPIVSKLLSPDEVLGMLLWNGFSCVGVWDVAGMSSAEMVEAVSHSIQPKAPSRIPIRDAVLEPVMGHFELPQAFSA